MKDFKQAIIFSISAIVLGTGAIAIYMVRMYLQLVGIVLLVAFVCGVVLAIVYAVVHVHRKITAYSHIPIAQYGSILQRHNQIVEIAPWHAPAPTRQPQLGTRYVESLDEPLDEKEAYQELPAHIPTFAQLLNEGVIQSVLQQGKMVLGYYAGTNEIRLGTWLDLYSCGIGGVSGSGKSTTVRFLLFQAVLAQARFIFIDPHLSNEEESLAAQFRAFPNIHQFPPCDLTTKAVLKRVQWLKAEFTRREKTGVKTPFLILVIDEFNAVMRSKEVKEELSELLLSIEQEARKFGIFAMLLAQRWSAQDLGGADIRTSLASFLAHRFTDEDQARKLVGSRNGPRCLELNTGHWFFRDTQGSLKEMVTPETLASDGAMVASIIGQPVRNHAESRYETALKAPETTLQIAERTTGDLVEEQAGFRVETTLESSSESTELIALARRIMLLQANGANKPDIMRQIWGVSPGANDAYRQAQEQYQTVMQFIASQIGA